MPRPYRYVRACAWAGWIMLPLTVLCWGVLGHNIPPFSPSLTAQELADQIRANATQIRIGMILQLPVSVLYFVWGVAISKVMQGAEKDNDVLSTMQLWGAGFTTIVFVLPCVLWLTISYRPDVMEPKTIQFFYDFSWFFFDMAYILTTLQTTAIGVCFLSDKRTVPLMPSWAAWLTIWVGISFVLETMMPLVYSGPFSRSGLLNYWIEFSLFFIMWIVVAFYTLKGVGRLEHEHAGQHGG
jgi:hypothetical protein